uniref:ArdC-like ssDNA-binding domain-containing protein n=1 Tax=Prevotella heparinolytica TaxID=28113 RepID=UPI0035A13FD1
KQDSGTDKSPGQGNQGLKPFPDNHFFSREELAFLSRNQDQCTLLQQWALRMSLWAKDKSNATDKSDPQFFPYVQWQNGLMSTWIDSEVIPEDIDKQADRLYQLQLEGYELSDEYVRMIEARMCRSLVSTLFAREGKEDKNGRKKAKGFIRVNSVVDKAGEGLALSVFHYNKVSHRHVSEETIPYKHFKSIIEKKKITALTNEAQRKWDEQATARDRAEQLFKDLITLMKRSNSCQGMFPANTSLVIRFEDGKDHALTSWSLCGDKIKLVLNPSISIAKSSVLVTAEESYLFVDVLDYISQSISEQDYTRELLLFVRVFGKDFCGDKVFSSECSLGCFGGIDINCVTAKASDTIVAFNSKTMEAASLSPEDRQTLLLEVLHYADSLLIVLESDLHTAADAAAKEQLQDKLDVIYQGLSVYDTESKYQTLEALWAHILSMFDVPRLLPRLAEARQPSAPMAEMSTQSVKPMKAEPSQPTDVEQRREEEVVDNGNNRTVTTSATPVLHPATHAQLESQDAPPLPEGYILLEPSPKGRWHTTAMMLREAYRVYGKLLSTKLKKQLDNENAPWVSKTMMIPRDSNGTAYTGSNAIMLALWTEEQGFDLPFFITEDEIRSKELGILQDAESLFVLGKDGATKVYNISQTTFPITQRRSYESLKLNMIAAERKKTSGYQFLDSDIFCKIPLQFDGRPNLPVYSFAEKVIHIAPKDNYATEDDYYRDLAVAMVESTREVDFDTLRLDTYLFENLVSHLGSGMISQSCRFDATNPEYSRIWRERLENNPEYTRMILEQSDIASCQILESALM